MSDILIYNDKGVDPIGVENLLSWLNSFDMTRSFCIKQIDNSCIKNSSWENDTDLLIVPGGADIPYHRLLRGTGCSKIRNFVEAGGSYLGICAGAYFGCSEIEFALRTKIEVKQSRELCFFQGTASGPIFKPFCYGSEKGASAAKVYSKIGEFYSYYNGGCTFSPIQENSAEILATYQEKDHKPAVVLCHCGKGKAILSGIHIEYSSNANFMNTSNPEIQNIIKLLKKSENIRNRFSKFVLESLL